MNEQQHLEKTLKERRDELERWHRQKAGLEPLPEEKKDEEGFKRFVKFMEKGCCG